MGNQEKINELFSYIKNTYSSTLVDKLSIKSIKSLLEVRQILTFQITVRDIRSDIDFLKDKLGLNGLDISINSDNIRDMDDIEKLNSDIEERKFSDEFTMRMTVIYMEKKGLPLEGNSTFYYLLDDLPDFMHKISKRLKVKDLKLLKNKISILNNVKNNHQTSIFSLSDFLNEEEIKLNKTLLDLISNPYLESTNCNILPNIYCSDDTKHTKKSAIDMLVFLSDRNEKNEIYFIGQNIKTINISDKTLMFEKNYKILSEIITFIYTENNMHVKLSLIKNLIYEKLESNSTINEITEPWLKTIKKQAEMEYKLFINEEVNKFINEKRDIIKDQFDLSYQIVEESNEIRKNLISNIVYIVGFFISSFVIEVINASDSFRNIAIILSFILSVFILVFYIVNGEFTTHKSFENKIKLINEQYPKMYLTEETLIDDINEKISNPEIKRLKKTEKIALIIYIFLVISSLLACIVLFWDDIISLINVIQSVLKK